MATGEFDRYGGWKGLNFQKTGFFRLEKSSGGSSDGKERWWFVSPEGNAYVSMGVNHIELSIVTSPHNRGHWALEFGIPPEKQHDGECFRPGFEKKVKADFQSVGFNAIGCHTDHEIFSESWVPYVKTIRFLDTCHYMGSGPEAYLDVFSDEFAAHCDKLAAKTLPPVRDDPYLLGYFFTDCPIYTDLDAAPHIRNIYGNARKGLPTFQNLLRNLPATAAGKKAYVDLVKKRYSSVKDFNDVYHTEFDSFEALEKKANWRTGIDLSNERETEDNLAFLYVILDKTFATEVAAVKKYDPNHLIFGDKINANTFTPQEIIRLCDRHFDIINYQIYGFPFEHREIAEAWSKITTKPLLIGDGSINVTSRELPDPYGPHCASQGERADMFREIANYLFSLKNFVGWHWCGWMDQWRYLQPGKQHAGFQDPFGNYYEVVVQMREFISSMYSTAAGKSAA
jgi:agarase